MSLAVKGNQVQVHYKGTLTDGTLFDSSEEREPLVFQLGSGMVIKGFDDGITGMAVGENKKIHIPVEDAYGPMIDELVITVNRLEIPENIPLEIGGTLNMHDGTQTVPVLIKEISATNVVLDANHPLAGQDLIFDITLVAIN